MPTSIGQPEHQQPRTMSMRKSEWLSLTQKERDDYWSLLTEKEKASFDLDRYLRGKPKNSEPIQPDACITKPDILAQVRESTCYKDFRAAINVFGVFFVGAGFLAIILGIAALIFQNAAKRGDGLILIGIGIVCAVSAYASRCFMATVVDIADFALEKESSIRRLRIIEKVK